MAKLKLSDIMLVVLENFTRLSIGTVNSSPKLKITPKHIEMKRPGIIGLYDSPKDDISSGFDEIVVADTNNFLQIVKYMGMDNAEYKEPFILFKKDNTKTKYCTSIKDVKDIDKNIIEDIKQQDNIIEDFEIDLNDLTEFHKISNTLGYKKIQFQAKGNILKVFALDETEIDKGFYEMILEDVELKDNNDIIKISTDRMFFEKIIKGRYTVSISNSLIRLYSKDIEGLVYFVVKEN
jgi:hypothetical protein